MSETTNTITAFEIEGATIALNFSCDALSAIANAIEVLSKIQPPPGELFMRTIPLLAAHAVYLSDCLKNEIGCFIDQVEAAK